MVQQFEKEVSTLKYICTNLNGFGQKRYKLLILVEGVGVRGSRYWF